MAIDISNKVWAELYRPTTLSQYIFADPGLEMRAKDWVSKGVFPNLILAGIQGTGKSTLARVLINDCNVTASDVLFIDGSVYNKVDDIRDKVVMFAEISPLGDYKVVVIEEAHRLTKDAQSALFETVERTSDYVRFIFTTNYPKKLLPPLLSRCELFTFDGFNEDAVLDLIADIIEMEQIELSDESAVNVERHIAAHKPDIRSIISSIQYSYFDGAIHPPSSSIKSSSIDDWTAIWSADKLDFEAAREMVYLADQTNYELFYTAIYENGLHHFEDPGMAVVQISEYLHRAMNVNTQGIQSIHLEALLVILDSEVGIKE